MSDAETDAVVTTPRSQYLSCQPGDQLSPRDPMIAGMNLKARAAGYQSPLQQLSPRNLKGAAVAAAGVLKGAAMAAAAADPAYAAALRAKTPSPRYQVTISPRPAATEEAGPSGMQRPRPSLPPPNSGSIGAGSSSQGAPLQEAPSPRSSPMPTVTRPVTSPFAASAATPAAEAAPRRTPALHKPTPTVPECTPQASAAVPHFTSMGCHNNAWQGSFAFREQQPAMKSIPSGSLQASGSIEGRDFFPANNQQLAPAPTPTAMAFNRFNSLPSGGIDSVDSLACPNLDLVMPVGGWRCSTLPRSNSCVDPSGDGPRRSGSHSSSRGGSRGASFSGQQLQQLQMGARNSVFANNSSVRRRSRGSNSGEAVDEAPNKGGDEASRPVVHRNPSMAHAHTASSIPRLNPSSTFSRRWESTELPVGLPETVLEVEGLTAASPAPGPAVQPASGSAATTATALRQAVAAVPTVVVAAVRQVSGSKVGRRTVMVGSLLLLGGLWALVANLPESGASLGLSLPGSAAATGPAATTTATATATSTATAPTTTTAAAGSTADIASKAATGTATSAMTTAAAAAAAAVGFGAAPGSVIIPAGLPAVNAYLVHQGAAAVVVGYVDAARLSAAAAAPTAAECANLAAQPAAQLLCA